MIKFFLILHTLLIHMLSTSTALYTFPFFLFYFFPLRLLFSILRDVLAELSTIFRNAILANNPFLWCYTIFNKTCESYLHLKFPILSSVFFSALLSSMMFICYFPQLKIAICYRWIDKFISYKFNLTCKLLCFYVVSTVVTLYSLPPKFTIHSCF